MVGRIRRSTVVALSVGSLVVASLVLSGATRGGALTDVDAPVLASLSLTPDSVDASNGPVTVTVVARVTDATSPSIGGAVPLSNLVLTGPGGQQHVTVYFSQAQRISGGPTDGMYQATATLRWHAEPGRWNATATLVDLAGNTRTMTTADLSSAGLPTGIDQTGPGDVTPPQLVSLFLSPPTVDTSLDSATVVVTARITDDLAGVSSGVGISASQVVLRGPTGTHHARASLDIRRRSSGDALDSTFVAPVTLWRWAEQGVWSVESVELVDEVGNETVVAAPGPSFTQIGIGDTVAPSFRAFTLSTTSVDVQNAAGTVGVNARLVDDRAGAAEGVSDSPSSVTFASPSGRQSARGLLGLAQRTSGTALDGTYHVVLSIPAHAEPGVWTLRSATAIDRAFNVANFAFAEWTAKGLPGTFTVVSDAPPDTGPTIPVGPTSTPTTLPTGSTSTSTTDPSASTSTTLGGTTSTSSATTTTTVTTTSVPGATTTTAPTVTTTTATTTPTTTTATTTATTTPTATGSTTTTVPTVGSTGNPVAADGYWLATASGRVAGFGGARTTAVTSARFSKGVRVTGISRLRTGTGYVLVGSNGDVRAFGSARTHGSLRGHKIPSPIVGIVVTKSGNGYWLAGRDGSVYRFGDARLYGSLRGKRLARPIIGITATRSGLGYRLLASDGGVYRFGDATNYGSTRGKHLHRPIVAMATAPSGRGYWLVGADGAIFPFGDATKYGSMSGKHLHAAIVGMAITPTGHGYWMVGADGAVFRFGDALSFGSLRASTSPVVGIAVHTLMT